MRLQPVVGKLDKKEMQKGKLCHSGSRWFEFTKAIDGLCCINLTSMNSLKCGATIVEQIDDATASSAWLEDMFKKCIPSSFSQDEKDHMLKTC